MVFSKKKINSLNMRIGIDARLYQEKGLGRYIRNLILHLQKIDKKNEYYIFLLDKDIDKLDLNKNFHKVSANYRWYTLKEQLELPKILSKYNLDLLHAPHFNIPIFYKGRVVTTIHDLIHQHIDTKHASTHNYLFYKFKRFAYKKVFSKAVKDSLKVITVSEFVKHQLIDEWNVNKNKIIVTYEAVDEDIIDLSSKLNKLIQEKILNKFNIKSPYLFYIGNAHPHKNVESLIKAFLELRKRYQYLQLVLAGDDNFFWPRLKKKYQLKDIIYTGKVSDPEMVAIYKNSKAFVTASKEEGFGLPILEAMTCDTAVISSNKGSLPEIGGEAALYFDPENKDLMIEKIAEVLDNKKIRDSLIEKGKKRVKLFNWEKLAKETLKVYEDLN